MTQNDAIGLIASCIHAFDLLGLAEAIRKWRGCSQAFTRKVVHSHKRSDSICLGGFWQWCASRQLSAEN